MDNGYHVWTFQGAHVVAVQKNKLYQFAWRPRPSTLLSAPEQRVVRAHIRIWLSRIYRPFDICKLLRAT